MQRKPTSALKGHDIAPHLYPQKGYGCFFAFTAKAAQKRQKAIEIYQRSWYNDINIYKPDPTSTKEVLYEKDRRLFQSPLNGYNRRRHLPHSIRESSFRACSSRWAQPVGANIRTFPPRDCSRLPISLCTRISRLITGKKATTDDADRAPSRLKMFTYAPGQINSRGIFLSACFVRFGYNGIFDNNSLYFCAFFYLFALEEI